jgi:hypothetical protein
VSRVTKKDLDIIHDYAYSAMPDPKLQVALYRVLNEYENNALGRDSSYCMCGSTKKGTVTAMSSFAGVPFEASFYKCLDCGQTWLSPKQEHQYDSEVIKILHKKTDKLENILVAIDMHIRQMRSEGTISMQDMITALKVISDGLEEEI